MTCAFCGNVYNSRQSKACPQCNKDRVEQALDVAKFFKRHEPKPSELGDSSTTILKVRD